MYVWYVCMYVCMYLFVYLCIITAAIPERHQQQQHHHHHHDGHKEGECCTNDKPHKRVTSEGMYVGR